MPGGTELAAAPDIRDDIHATLGHPQHADIRRIGWRERNLETSIAVEYRRCGTTQLLLSHHEVWNLGSVSRSRLELLCDQTSGIKSRRKRFDCMRSVLTFVSVEARGTQKTLEGEMRLGPKIIG